MPFAASCHPSSMVPFVPWRGVTWPHLHTTRTTFNTHSTKYVSGKPERLCNGLSSELHRKIEIVTGQCIANVHIPGKKSTQKYGSRNRGNALFGSFVPGVCRYRCPYRVIHVCTSLNTTTCYINKSSIIYASRNPATLMKTFLISCKVVSIMYGPVLL